MQFHFFFFSSNVKFKKYLRSVLRGNPGSGVKPKYTEPRQNFVKLTVSSKCSIANGWIPDTKASPPR